MLKKIWNAPLFRLILLVLVCFLVMLDLWGLTLMPGVFDHERAGDLADWFTGLLTLGAVVVAILAFRAEQLRFEQELLSRQETLREEEERLNVKEYEARREAAARIYCWLEGRLDYTGSRLTEVVFCFRNLTPLPVYQWSLVICEVNEMKIDASEYGIIPPGDSEFLLKDTQWQDALVERLRQPPRLVFLANNGEWLERGTTGEVSVIAPFDEK